jgi:AraC family transcriptional regulator, exoenzyme S synthesis regulatory protein ExsA
MITVNYYERVKAYPEIFTQLTCKELLFVHYKCPLIERLIGKWSQHNYILCVLSGKLAYHTPGRSWLLTGGSAMFVKKGAVIMEKFFEEELCIMTFFIPDSYMCSFLRENPSCMGKGGSREQNPDLVIPLGVSDIMKGYINSLIPYFTAENVPSEDLLELKFRELLFNILTNPANDELNEYLQTLLLPNADRLQEVMEANCLFNLSLENYAKLCNRSLSSFKRDFFAVYKTNPGQWLSSKKLNHSHHLLLTTNKTVNDISYESGFENSTHFSKAFKKRFGLSPLQYRHQALIA